MQPSTTAQCQGELGDISGVWQGILAGKWIKFNFSRQTYGTYLCPRMAEFAPFGDLSVSLCWIGTFIKTPARRIRTA